ncbi:hypothetical protein GCM10009754_87390 [Amycolatopsis minnesotensis]|uniref:Uncharacterized protein n=1 Tax=Amycolatopsis minnesotensis TaxID=337894 RepID=A0ABN2SYG4_9PSEU
MILTTKMTDDHGAETRPVSGLFHGYLRTLTSTNVATHRDRSLAVGSNVVRRTVRSVAQSPEPWWRGNDDMYATRQCAECGAQLRRR